MSRFVPAVVTDHCKFGAHVRTALMESFTSIEADEEAENEVFEFSEGVCAG